MRYIFAILLLLPCLVQASDQIEFPSEELASETVLPVFQEQKAVKNRLVTVDGRVEFGVGLGWNLTEALYESTNLNLNFTYHFDEEQGLNLSGYFIREGLSNYGEDLKAGKGLDPGDSFDASLAPTPENLVLLSYQYSAYYGKISLSKNYFMNLSLYGLAGVGMMKYSDSSEMALNLGLGQKFYFNKSWALRFDLRAVAFKGPNPMDTSADLRAGGSPVSSSDLESVVYVNTILSAGLVILL